MIMYRSMLYRIPIAHIFWATFLYVAVKDVFGIKCWECKSHADPRCADPFDNTSLPIAECGHRTLPHLPGIESTMCRKTRQKVNGNWRVIRSCAYLGIPGEGQGSENYCLMRTGIYDVFVETCTCDSKDGCNHASNSVNLSSAVIFALVIFTLLFIR